MQVEEQTTPTDSKSLWRRVLADVSVTYVWAYDTVAILDDYYDSEAGTLPAGQLVRFSAAAEKDPNYFICDLDDCRFIEHTQLPHGRIFRSRPWCSATRLQAVIAVPDYKALTADAVRPSWWQRLFRRITQ